MNRRRFIRNFAVGAAGVSFGMFPKELLANEDFITISILHTNDLHCHIEPFIGSNDQYNGKGGIARISEFANNSRKINPNTLLLDAGDMFQGTSYFNYFKGELILKVMSEAGYDAGTIGNHEFDNGIEELARQVKNAKFPFVCSNYNFEDTPMKGLTLPFKTFDKGEIKVGVA